VRGAHGRSRRSNSIGAGSAIVATASGPVTVGAGAALDLSAGGNINAKAANIKLNA
jgi:hypothetical protein